MRLTFTELLLQGGEYVEVESVREWPSMQLVSQEKTGTTYPQREWKTAVREMNRKNRERREAEKAAEGGTVQ